MDITSPRWFTCIPGMLIVFACMGCVWIGAADSPRSLVSGKVSCLSGPECVLFSVIVRDREGARIFGGVEMTRSRDADRDLGDSVTGIGVAGRWLVSSEAISVVSSVESVFPGIGIGELLPSSTSF